MIPDSLIQKLALLARPGITVTSNDGDLRFGLSAASSPQQELVVYIAAPTVKDLSEHETDVIKGFSEFSETAAILIDHALQHHTQPLELSQLIFNRALFTNSSGWRDYFDFRLEFLEERPEMWREN